MQPEVRERLQHVLTAGGYATVYDEGVWGIIGDHLPLLLSEVRSLLGPTSA